MLKDDIKLLKLIYQDSLRVKKEYKPGPYWKKKSKNSFIEIRKNGVGDFRSGLNAISASYGDAAIIDTRSLYNVGIRKFLKWIYNDMFILKNLFNTQVKYTQNYFNKWLRAFNQNLKQNERAIELLKKYPIDFETTRGGCSKYFTHNKVKISHHYLNILDSLDRINTLKPISPDHNYLEIGGGFGVNTHLLIELFGLRKIIYLDIAPNLYVATQYLKSFYGNKVISYDKTKDKKIKFSNNNEIEIYCVLPHQIENITSEIDHFHNAHSFVEMTYDIVKNYSVYINKILNKKNGFVSLISYQDDNLVDINKVSKLFNGELNKSSYKLIDGENLYNQYIID